MQQVLEVCMDTMEKAFSSCSLFGKKDLNLDICPGAFGGCLILQ